MDLTRRTLLVAGGVASLAAANWPTGSLAETNPPSLSEGYAALPGGKVWWRKVGSGSKTPLVLLHGGPGAGHDYLEPLQALAGDRPVILYDQLGCGRSDRPDEPSLWTIDHFVREIDLLRRALHLPHIILYGHSWGGWLAQEYLRSGAGADTVEALILASTSASTAEFVAGATRLLAALPDGMDAKRLQLEEAGRIDSPEYKAIVDAFYDRHLVHMDRPPAYLTRSFENLASSRTYPVMNGPNEFTVTGTLQGWDARSALAAIHVPTLILTAEWDEVTLDCHQRLHAGIRGSQLVVIPKARHLAMVERPQAYLRTMAAFLGPLA